MATVYHSLPQLGALAIFRAWVLGRATLFVLRMNSRRLAWIEDVLVEGSLKYPPAERS